MWTRVDVAIHEHPVVRERHESGAITFRCVSRCEWQWWLAPVPAANPAREGDGQAASVAGRLTAAEKAAGRRGVSRARAVLAAAPVDAQPFKPLFVTARPIR